MNVVRYFDPGRDGFVRRMARVVVVVAALGACVALAGVSVALRSEMGRFALATGLSGANLYVVALPLSRDLRHDFPTSNWHYYRLEARNLRRLGRIPESLAVYDDAIAALPAEWWAHSHRCFYNALLADARAVMDSCDRQIALDPDWPDVAYDRRAIARILVGDHAGAISDLHYAIGEMRRTAPSDRRIPIREAWLEQLRAGENPITAAVIQAELSHY